MKLIISLIVFTLIGISGNAQELIRTNPADITDSKILFINPAVLPKQNMAFNIGMKVYQVGFILGDAADLRHSYSSNSFPGFMFKNLGVGITLQNFNTPFHNVTGIGFSAGYLIIEGLAVGITAKANNLSYNQESFDLVIKDDPVFANGTGQWNGSFDAGFLVSPNKD